MNDTIMAVNRNEITALVLLDHFKASDTMNHDVLLAILHFIDLSGTAIALIDNYLTVETNKYVRLNGNLSNIRNIGSTTGSILGPFVFSIYTSNLPNFMSLIFTFPCRR